MKLTRFLGETFGRLERTDDDGTSEDIWQSNISEFWAGLSGSSGFSATALHGQGVGGGALQAHERERHLHHAPSPLRVSRASVGGEPRPGVVPERHRGRHVRRSSDSLYGWGDAFVYVTSRYADGYPSCVDGARPRADDRERRAREARCTSPATRS